MTPRLEIAAAWEKLEEGSAEERACFGMLVIRSGTLLLSEGIDGFVDRRRDGPLVSNYHLAEWLAWNWWRITSEPRPQTETREWAFSHCLSTIGEGYVWPNITISSDLERTLLVAKPSRKRGFASFRSTADWSVVLPTGNFEHAVDRFVGQIQGQLRAEGVGGTNLDRIWEELCAERDDPGMTIRRRLEALLGFEPDEADPTVITQLVADTAILGQHAVDELAADQTHARKLLNADRISQIAAAIGADAKPADAARLAPRAVPIAKGEEPPWRHGYENARALREQEQLGSAPLTDERLVKLAGVSLQALTKEPSGQVGFSFALDETPTSGRVVLRSKWQTGRRFELARLLGDRIVVDTGEALLPATQSYTYRQKLQRTFAAELLCPFDGLEAKLGRDYSPEAIDDAAEHFAVSPLTVRAHLVNHSRLPRDDLEGDFVATEAA